MKLMLLHTLTPTGSEKQLAVNADEILRMEEVEGGTTQVIQMDKGPTTVKESLTDILKALGEEVCEVRPKAEPKSQPPIGQAHARGGMK